MERIVRCQGAVLHNSCILLVKHKNIQRDLIYWWLPGGGLNQGETQEECVIREIQEETCIDVRVERLLFQVEDLSRRYSYQRYATYLCSPISGEVAIGSEGGQSSGHPIIGIGWYPLWDESCWESGFYAEHLYPFLQSIQVAVRAEQP